MVEVLQQGPINKTQLRKRGKDQGYGRARIDAIVEKLQGQKRLKIKKEGKSAMLHLRNNNVAVAPLPYRGSNNVLEDDGDGQLPVLLNEPTEPTTTCEEDVAELFGDTWAADGEP